MAKDNREVLQNLRVPAGEKRKRGMLTVNDTDEIASTFTQKELDGLVSRGVLAGDWKATKGGAQKAKDD